MQANKAYDTTPELRVRSLLRDGGMTDYRTAYSRVAGRPDIAFSTRRLAIFVHGCFWHRCPHCRLPLPRSNRAFWKRKFQLNRARDRRKEKALRSLGWSVVNIWECTLKPRNRRRLESFLRQVRRLYERPLRPERAPSIR